jgi:hypothetical protein
MDKDVYKALNEKEQIYFAELYDSPNFKTIIKAVDLYQKQKAMATIANSPDHESTVLNRGMNLGARFIADLAKHSHKEKACAKTPR